MQESNDRRLRSCLRGAMIRSAFLLLSFFLETRSCGGTRVPREHNRVSPEKYVCACLFSVTIVLNSLRSSAGCFANRNVLMRVIAFFMKTEMMFS